MKSLIISNELIQEETISLLKIKLDFIINVECTGKKRFLIMVILVLLTTFSLLGVSRITMILESIYRLFLLIEQ